MMNQDSRRLPDRSGPARLERAGVPAQMAWPRIVIVGAGFAGVAAARALLRCDGCPHALAGRGQRGGSDRLSGARTRRQPLPRLR
jgi:hypothetical protein